MHVELKPQAIKDLQGIQKQDAVRITSKLAELEAGLTGDIKRLTNFTPEYRLRVGNYRVLFEIVNPRLSCIASCTANTYTPRGNP